MRIRSTFCLLIVLIGQLTYSQTGDVGMSLFADFDGDYSREYAFVVQSKSPVVDSVGNVSGGEYKVLFSIAKLGEINIGCCQIKLILEGDLNNDGNAELSIYQNSGIIHTLTTYSFVDSAWKVIIPSFTIAKSGKELTDEDLQSRVFAEKGEIFYYDTIEPNTSGKLIKKSVTSINQ